MSLPLCLAARRPVIGLRGVASEREVRPQRIFEPHAYGERREPKSVWDMFGNGAANDGVSCRFLVDKANKGQRDVVRKSLWYKELNGGRYWTRTSDLYNVSVALCQLS